MNRKYLIALSSVLLSIAAPAAPFLAIGDGAELFVTGTLSVRSDDNIFLSSKATSDTIWDINPGVSIEFGKNGDVRGSLVLVDAFANYSDHSFLNTNLFSGDFMASYDDKKTKMDFNVGYHELNQNTVDTRAGSAGGFLVRRDQFLIGTKGEVETSAITSVAAGVSFDHFNYKRTGFADSDELKVPVSLYYKWTAKTQLSMGYTYSNYQTTIGHDSNDHFFNVGMRGELLPSLTGEIKVGVDQRNVSQVGSRTDPGLDASATYEYSPKTSIVLTAGNKHSTTPQGIQTKDLSLGVQARFVIDQNWSANAGLVWRDIAYSRFVTGPHDDTYVDGILGASYVISSSIRIDGSYNYRDNRTNNINGSAFSGNIFTLAVNFRY